jgi:hypothetical protein
MKCQTRASIVLMDLETIAMDQKASQHFLEQLQWIILKFVVSLPGCNGCDGFLI